MKWSGNYDQAGRRSSQRASWMCADCWTGASGRTLILISLPGSAGHFGTSELIHPDDSTDGMRRVDIRSGASVCISAWPKSRGRLRGSGRAEGTGDTKGFRASSETDDRLVVAVGEGISGIRLESMASGSVIALQGRARTSHCAGPVKAGAVGSLPSGGLSPEVTPLKSCLLTARPLTGRRSP